MVLAARRGAAIDAERDRDATEARYREEHRGTGDPTADRARGHERGAVEQNSSQRTLAVTLAADARADAMLADQEARVRAQRRASDRMAFLVPPALVNESIVELAGNGYDTLGRLSRPHR